MMKRVVVVVAWRFNLWYCEIKLGGLYMHIEEVCEYLNTSIASA